MSQENVEMVRAALEAFEQGGLDSALRFYDPEITWEEAEASRGSRCPGWSHPNRAMRAVSGATRMCSMRVVGFMALAVVLGVATGLVLERVIVGVLVGAGVVLLGLFILLARADSTDAEV
jgi:hypothetical protein